MPLPHRRAPIRNRPRSAPGAGRRPGAAIVAAVAAAASVLLVRPSAAPADDAAGLPPPPATRPATRPDKRADVRAEVEPLLAHLIAIHIDLLGDESFKFRQMAAENLWRLGDVAVPALREAAKSGNPEVARRARNLLASIAFGIRPDTPMDVLVLLADYRQGNAEQKKTAIEELTRQGLPGTRVMMKLAEVEPDPTLKKILLTGLTFVARPSAAALAAEGDLATANRLLEAVAGEGEAPARDHAAFLLVTGGLDEAVAGLSKTLDPATRPATPPARLSPLEELMRLRRIAQGQAPGGPGAGGAGGGAAATGDALRLVYLWRAKGDPARAAAVADAAGDVQAADSLLADAGRFAELAKRAEARGVNDASVEELGFVTAYHRLAGHRADADRWAKKLVEHGKTNPGNEGNAAEALMLNGYPAEAVDLLVDRKAVVTALEFVGARFDFALAERLAAEAKAAGGPDLPRVLAKTAPLVYQAGRSAEATAQLRAVAAGTHGPVTLDVWQDLVEAGPVSGVPAAEVDGWLARALTAGDRRPGDSPNRLFFRARLLDPERAMGWWVALQDHRVGLTGAEAMALVRRLDRGQVAGDELAGLLARTKEHAATLPPPERAQRLTLVADTLADREDVAGAIAAYEPLAADLPSAETASKLGDLYAKAKQWEKAAASFAKARSADPDDAKAVALQSWCVGQLGRADEAKRLMDLAHLMPLADEAARNALAEVLAKHGLAADARRERELTERTGDVRTWAYTDSLRRLAGDIAKADPLAAADVWERAFLSNLRVETSFVDPTANLTIPVLIRRARAVGQVRAGRYAEAVAGAAACLDLDPADADAQIMIVRELDKAGRKAEADGVYRRAFDRYEAVRAKYPQSAQANNLVAWMTACVKRDTDHALACARKAIELEPDNASILDTLSEAHFARGEYDDALKVNARCRELEPYVPHHKRNLARFTAAKAGKPTDYDPTTADDD